MADSDIDADPHMRTHPRARTPTVAASTSPEWDCGFAYPLLATNSDKPLGRNLEEDGLSSYFRVPLVLSVWHRISPLSPPSWGGDDEESDADWAGDDEYDFYRKNAVLIGKAHVDLSSLPTLRIIDGWYHITGKHLVLGLDFEPH